MIVGKPIINVLFFALVAVAVFFLAQWIIPLLFGLVGLHIPEHITNILSLLVALGTFWYGGWRA